jgi:hypothetical protein
MEPPPKHIRARVTGLVEELASAGLLDEKFAKVIALTLFRYR